MKNFCGQKRFGNFEKNFLVFKNGYFQFSQKQTFFDGLPSNGTVQNSEVTLCNAIAATENHPNLFITLFSCEKKINDVAISVAQSNAVKYGLV